jgi:hypothetical protein
MAIDQAAPREANEAAGAGRRAAAALAEDQRRRAVAGGAPDPDAAVPGRLIDGLRSL